MLGAGLTAGVAMGRIALGLCAVVLPSTVEAAEVGGVRLADRTEARDGTPLVLHGAGVRDKFYYDIYVAALYLPQSGQSAEAILAADQPARVEIYFVYEEIERDDLVDAWREGFEENNPDDVLARLEPSIQRFVDLFSDTAAGDTFTIEYVPGEGTQVAIDGEHADTILGGDFFRALLAAFVGPEPPDKGLKRGMLGRDRGEDRPATRGK